MIMQGEGGVDDATSTISSSKEGSLLTKCCLMTFCGVVDGVSISRNDIKGKKHARSVSAKRTKEAQALANTRRQASDYLMKHVQESKSCMKLCASVISR